MTAAVTIRTAVAVKFVIMFFVGGLPVCRSVLMKPIGVRQMATVKQMLSKNPPLPRDDLRHPEWEPEPVEDPRLQAHLRESVRPDLLLMLYDHDREKSRETLRAAAQQPRLFKPWDGSQPWHANTPNRLVGGRGPVLPLRPLIDDKTTPNLKSVTLQTFSKGALLGGNAGKQHLRVAHMVLMLLTGRRAETIKAKRSIASWKLREGFPCGARVTLTGVPMYNFLQNLTELALPQLKDFEGVRYESVDECGNVGIGLTPQVVQYFPEVQATFDQFPTPLPGLDVSICTTARSKHDGRLLVSSFFPFKAPVKQRK